MTRPTGSPSIAELIGAFSTPPAARPLSADLATVLAERFGTKPVRPSVMQLVDQLVDAALDGLQAEEGSDAEEVHALKCEQLRSEIQRRVDELGGGL